MARIAFATIVSHDPATGRDFGIGLAEENEPGYWPKPEHGPFATWDLAAAKARELNHRLGLSDEEAAHIVASSMRRRKS